MYPLCTDCTVCFHRSRPENNISEVTSVDAGNDVNVENKTEEKKKSKKRKKTKKNE